MTDLLDEFNFRAHLNAYWLRPESAIWDCIAAKSLSAHLASMESLAEIGIGNGYFSFLMLGGEFAPGFDWFHNVETEGFWSNSDIYNHDQGIGGSSWILRYPSTRLACAVDHKSSLLKQAERLGFIDATIEHDCNYPLPRLPCKNAYSNMLYWLQDPITVMHRIGEQLPEGGQLIIAFPNSSFYEACTSYTDPAPLWKLLNRGRANSIMWHMDLPDFERQLGARGMFDIQHFQRYLAPLTLKLWDIGFRPMTVPLIKMANALSPEIRAEIKQEWCDTVAKFAPTVLENELQRGFRHGGFNLVVLKRK